VQVRGSAGARGATAPLAARADRVRIGRAPWLARCGKSEAPIFPESGRGGGYAIDRQHTL